MTDSRQVRDTMLGFDQSVRWNCRAGDFIVWVRCTNPFFGFGRADSFQMVEFWELRDGDHILLTSRSCDVPPGANDPDSVAMNLWRALPGDRFAWSGCRRAGSCGGRDPDLLGLIECGKRILVYGDSARPRHHPEHTYLQLFGEPTSQDLTPQANAAMAVAWQAAVSLGTPRSWSESGPIVGSWLP